MILGLLASAAIALAPTGDYHINVIDPAQDAAPVVVCGAGTVPVQTYSGVVECVSDNSVGGAYLPMPGYGRAFYGGAWGARGFGGRFGGGWGGHFGHGFGGHFGGGHWTCTTTNGVRTCTRS